MTRSELASIDAKVAELIAADPALTNNQIAQSLGMTYEQARCSLKRLGITRKNGRPTRS